jgi:Flp pilus assembly protein TadD
MAGGSDVTDSHVTRTTPPEQIEAELLDRARQAFALQQQGDFGEAERIYREILAVDENHFNATQLLGVIAAQVRDFEAAAELMARAIGINPNDAVAHSNLGNVLLELERYEDALASQRNAIALDPNYPPAYSNQANALRELGRFEEARASCDEAIALDPNFADAWSNRGGALLELLLCDEALASYDQAISLNGGLLDARLNRANLYLAMGEFERGWREYELRMFKPSPVPLPSFEQPPWLGEEDLRERSILVHYEQGMGDIIQFCRYVPQLCERGARVMFAPWPKLIALMRSLDGAFELVDLDAGIPEFDYHCPLLSLPLAFGTSAATIPSQESYLSAEPERVAHWASKIGTQGFRIGICWQGRTGKVDLGRSFPIGALSAISRVPGIRLISLHKGDGEAQLADLPDGMAVETLGDAFDAGPDAFLDSAAAIDSCDLVISSDTSIAHLACALGRPCWIALKHLADWRWMLDRRDSPWYPTARLFRQPSAGDWSSVFGEMEAELRSLLAARS